MVHEYIAQPGASGGLAGASGHSSKNQQAANSTNRLAHRNSDTPADGRVDRSRYNAAGRLELVGNALGEYVRYAFDVPSNTLTTSSARTTSACINALPT